MCRPLSHTVVLIATLALLTAGLTGCSDDDTGGNNAQDTGSFLDAADSGEDAASDANADSGSDAEDTGSDASDASDTSDTSDAADAGDAADTSDTTDTSEPVDPELGHSGCTYPADGDGSCSPDDFGNHGPGSFLNEFAIQGGGECCRDFDGDGSDDSALGDLVASMEFILGVDDFNEDVIAPQIASGDIVFLFEYAYWSDAVEDPALAFDLIFGEDTDADFAPNMAGNGDFFVDPNSLDSNGDPKSDFPAASVANAHLSVPSGSAPLVLPVASELVETRVDDLQIEADVVGGTADLHAAGRVELTDGEISGIITLDEMFSSLNIVAAGCTCITTAPLFVEISDDSWSCQATQSDQNACASSTSMCQTLSTPSDTGFANCGVVRQLITDAADINLDADPADEALSLGATFNAVGASINDAP